MAGIENAVILTNQFLAAIARDFAEFVIGIDDVALGIGDRDDCMRINAQLVRGESGGKPAGSVALFPQILSLLFPPLVADI